MVASSSSCCSKPKRVNGVTTFENVSLDLQLALIKSVCDEDILEEDITSLLSVESLVILALVVCFVGLQQSMVYCFIMTFDKRST